MSVSAEVDVKNDVVEPIVKVKDQKCDEKVLKLVEQYFEEQKMKVSKDDLSKYALRVQEVLNGAKCEDEMLSRIVSYVNALLTAPMLELVPATPTTEAVQVPVVEVTTSVAEGAEPAV